MSSPIRLSAGERWLGATAPIGRVSRTMGLVAGASLLGHLAVMGAVGVAARQAPQPPREIAVELVQEVPKPAPAKPEPAKSEPAKPESTKSEAPKSEPPKQEAAKVEPAKPEPPKPEQARLEPKQPEPKETTKVAKSEPRAHQRQAKAEPKVAMTPPAPSRDAAAEDRNVAALQQELAALKAEQAQIAAEHAAEAQSEAAQARPVALRDSGLGVLPASFQAVALPSVTDGPGEAASYEAIVFSALAKAKGIGARQGVPGTAGLRFTLDATGKLVDVELVHWSGVPDLDAEALALVRRAAFPPPPQGAQRTFVANVNFEAQRAR